MPPVLVAIVLGAFAVAHFASYPGRTSADPLINSPHENVRYELAERWIDEGEPTYPLPLHDRLPADVAPALTPRDAGLLDGAVVPKDFAYSIALTTGLRAVAPWLPGLTTTVSAVCLLLVTGLVGRHALGSRAGGLLAATLLAATTPFWSATAGLMESGGVTAALLLTGVLLLLSRRRRALAASGDGAGHGPVPYRVQQSTVAVLPRTENGGPRRAMSAVGLDVLAGAVLGAAVGTHYATVLLAAGIALAFAWRREGGTPTRLAALVAGAVVALLPVLAFNAWIYGSPLTDGYSVGVDFLDSSIGDNTGGLFTLRPSLLVDHLRLYVLRWEVGVLLGLAAVGLWTARRSGAGAGASGPPAAAATPTYGSIAVLGRACLLGGLPFLVFSGARPLSGSAGFLVNASLMRYLAPVAALLAVIAAGGVMVIGRRNRLAAGVLVTAAVVGGLAVVANGSQGPFDIREQVPRSRDQRALALRVIPEDAVVITGRSDKFLWPARATLTAPYLVDEPPAEGDDTHLALRAPTPTRLAEVVDGVSDEGLEVYMWNEGRWFNGRRRGAFADLDALLAVEGIERLETDLPGLWRFEAG